MKRALGPRPCAKSFNCFANSDPCSSLTATRELSSENSSPLAITESDSTCSVGEPAIETEEPIVAVSPRAAFTWRANSTGVAASQSLAVLSPACRQNLSTVRTKPRPRNRILMVKRGDQLARDRTPEFSRVVSACRQDPSAVGTELRLKDLVLVPEERCLLPTLPTGTDARPG